MQVQLQYGTEAIERFAFRVLDLAKLDKNNDGNVDAQEWGQAVFGLIPELLNIKQLTNEVRDLSVEEIASIVGKIGANFPDYRGLDDQVERVIRAALKFLALTTQAGYELLLEVKKLNKTNAPALEVNTEAKKAKTAGKK